MIQPEAKQRLDGLAVSVALLLCVLWGVQQVASKVSITQGVPPFFQAVIRSVVAGLLLLGWIGLRSGRRGLAGLLARDGSWAPGALTAGLFAVEFLCLFRGVQLTSASRAVVLLFTGPFFTAIGTHVFVPGERLRLVHVAGLLLAFAGVAVTLADSGGGGSLAGDIMVLGAAAGWGLTTVVVKASPALQAVSPERVLAYQLWGSLPILVVAALLAGELRWPQATALAWTGVAYQCVVVCFASYLTWFWLVARYPAGKLSAFTFLTPLLGVFAAWLLLGEPLTPLLFLGLLCVGVGLRLVNRA